MTWNGCLPAHACVKCGKELKGNNSTHPAELYAGTYNGLCYSCTHNIRYVEKTYRDGATLWNYPPQRPSWRRDREKYVGYSQCPHCQGAGRYKNGELYEFCRPCQVKFDNEPVRKAKHEHFQRRYDSIYNTALSMLEKQRHLDDDGIYLYKCYLSIRVTNAITRLNRTNNKLFSECET